MNPKTAQRLLAALKALSNEGFWRQEDNIADDDYDRDLARSLDEAKAAIAQAEAEES